MPNLPCQPGSKQKTNKIAKTFFKCCLQIKRKTLPAKMKLFQTKKKCSQKMPARKRLKVEQLCKLKQNESNANKTKKLVMTLTLGGKLA